MLSKFGKIPYFKLLLGGEQVLSCKEPGGLFATCELGNFPLWGNFLTEARALPRETLSRHPFLSVPRLRE